MDIELAIKIVANYIGQRKIKNDMVDFLESQQAEIDRSNTIIGNYLKTIQESTDKMLELYGIIQGLKDENDKLRKD